MADLYARVKKRCKATADNWKNDRQFSSKLAMLRFADDIGGRLGLCGLSARAHKQKDEFILAHLKNLLAPIIERYKNDTYQGEEPKDPAPIWVCWWSGEESAPALVRQCIKSIRKNAGCHPVNLIDEKNYAEYLSIPEYILQKVKSGRMCIANFSDYLRVSLLSTYGGIWLDATIFCSRTIPEQYFEMPLFTCKSEPVECRYLSKFRWTSFCIGGNKGHVFYRFFKAALETYWQHEQSSIDYLLVDYIIETAYRNIPVVNDDMDAVPLNNLRRDNLQAAMNAALPAEMFWNVVKEDTVLYKLSWRENYSEKTLDGEPTVYDYFLKMPL